MLNKRMIAIAIAGVFFLTAGNISAATPPVATSQPSAGADSYAADRVGLKPDGALALLKEGNQRFVQQNCASKNFTPARREALFAGQKPFAVIVCCSDSRVPPELIFDQGLGDIFIVRVAGNVIDPVVLGSVEYGVEHLHAPLVVVLGHEECGAVKATLQGGEVEGSVAAIVQRIQVSEQEAAARGQKGPAALSLVTDLNILNSVGRISTSRIVSQLVQKSQLQVVGAKYHLKSGEVEWLAPTTQPSSVQGEKAMVEHEAHSK